MNKTNIPYLDFTWSPTHGCSHIADGCDHCWAKAMSKRLAGMGAKGYDPADPFKVVCDESRLAEPLARKKPARIGVSFMGDLFHKDVPPSFIFDVFESMMAAPRHTYLLLTKRPARAAKLLGRGDLADPLPNVWLGTSASTQADLDCNLPELLKCPAALRWLSLEPLIEEVSLYEAEALPNCYAPKEAPSYAMWRDDRTGLQWVVVGCESGPGRRECKTEWIKQVVDECDAAGVPCYVKQIGWHGKVIYPGDPNWPTWAKQEMP